MHLAPLRGRVGHAFGDDDEVDVRILRRAIAGRRAADQDGEDGCVRVREQGGEQRARGVDTCGGGGRAAERFGGEQTSAIDARGGFRDGEPGGRGGERSHGAVEREVRHVEDRVGVEAGGSRQGAARRLIRDGPVEPERGLPHRFDRAVAQVHDVARPIHRLARFERQREEALDSVTAEAARTSAGAVGRTAELRAQALPGKGARGPGGQKKREARGWRLLPPRDHRGHVRVDEEDRPVRRPRWVREQVDVLVVAELGGSIQRIAVQAVRGGGVIAPAADDLAGNPGLRDETLDRDHGHVACGSTMGRLERPCVVDAQQRGPFGRRESAALRERAMGSVVRAREAELADTCGGNRARFDDDVSAFREPRRDLRDEGGRGEDARLHDEDAGASVAVEVGCVGVQPVAGAQRVVQSGRGASLHVGHATQSPCGNGGDPRLERSVGFRRKHDRAGRRRPAGRSVINTFGHRFDELESRPGRRCPPPGIVGDDASGQAELAEDASKPVRIHTLRPYPYLAESWHSDY